MFRDTDKDIATEVKRYNKAKSKSSPNLSSLKQDVGLPTISTQHTQPSIELQNCPFRSDIIQRAHANLCCCCCSSSFISCYDNAKKCKNLQDIYEKLDNKKTTTHLKNERSKNEPVRRAPDPTLINRSKSMINLSTGNPILYRDIVPLGEINTLILQRFPDAYLFKRTKQCKPDCSGFSSKKIKISNMAYEIQDIDEGKQIDIDFLAPQNLLSDVKKNSNQPEDFAFGKQSDGFDFMKRIKRKSLSERISDVLRKSRPSKKNQR